MEFEVSFLVSGYIKQIIRLNSDVKITHEELQEGLMHRSIFTTVEEDGEILDSQLKVIGTVISVKDHTKYGDFDVKIV